MRFRIPLFYGTPCAEWAVAFVMKKTFKLQSYTLLSIAAI